ncbi:mycofactocin oligosaccharide methyltransferase MftM [Arthrobacter sp. NEB 688]|uniref:mycofactocin oligosaccharide methyltransferase MftM n=1 Tax=Arthrobacter sp. NEB 688 TaxID=904039 RepID=UPI001565A911|nr:mycofactocin oligosaccharide methyltransferase MftM [Arthrobacter sp. NEB 688]QKE83886.1 class I SAM-dependent methyltransferase [Arthrobacter sp. NEB 688]
MTVAPIDALAPLVGACYRDGVVTVRPRRPDTRMRLGAVRTPHFDLVHDGADLVVEHGLGLSDVDDDLAGLLSDELFEAGWLRGSELFERVFTGVVLTCADRPEVAWEAFYANTLAAVGAAARSQPTPGTAAGHGCIRDYAPVYARAESLVRGRSVLELGSCFGFLALRVAADGRTVTASDVSGGTMRLLAAMAPRFGVDVQTLACDAAHVPLPDRSADTVLAVHLLEHLEPDHAAQVLREACRVARGRVVVGVPLEDSPSEQYGHLWAVSLETLREWGRAAAGWRADVSEHHGGWLVLDRG